MWFEDQLTTFISPEFLTRFYAGLWLVEFGLMRRWLFMFYRTEDFGGYRDSYRTRCLNASVFQTSVIWLWIIVHLALLISASSVALLLTAVLLNHRFFVLDRWKSLLRGMGAPGYMLFWMSVAVMLNTISSEMSMQARSSVLGVLIVDFAAIMIMAGVYKLRAGYRTGFGIEYGMVNPQWSYFAGQFSKLKSNSVFFRILNELSWSLEVAGGLLLLWPSTRLIGGAIIVLSFLFLFPLIRLGVLCLTVAGCTISICFNSVEVWYPFWGPFVSASSNQDRIIALVGAVYIVSMFITRLIQILNVFGHRRPPNFVQRFADSFATVFGTILWRVFTPDVTGFTIAIDSGKRGSGQSAHSLMLKAVSVWGKGRFSLVEEAIAVTSLFSLRRYLPDQIELFNRRLLRHAASLCDVDRSVRYSYVEIQKRNNRFDFVCTASFIVDLESKTVLPQVLSGSNVDRPIGPSPVRTGLKLGSYVQQNPRSTET